MPGTDLLQDINAALARHPGLQRHRNVHIVMEDDVIVLSGTLDHIAAKRLIPRIAVEATGGLGVRDRLRVTPQNTQDDAELAAAIERSLAEDPLFSDYQVTSRRPDEDQAPERTIGVQVSKGVVELTGRVEGLRRRRLAEALAWQSPGCADVLNRLYVSPAEQDSDTELADAVRLVLQRDPQVEAGRIGVRAVDRVVTLIGTLADKVQRQLAERDAWYVAGVHDVDNCIRVLSPEELDECADEASRESFPASDPPSMTPVVGVGGTDKKGGKSH